MTHPGIYLDMSLGCAVPRCHPLYFLTVFVHLHLLFFACIENAFLREPIYVAKQTSSINKIGLPLVVHIKFASHIASPRGYCTGATAADIGPSDLGRACNLATYQL